MVNNSQIGSMFHHNKEECPPGTVPIQRMKYNFSEEKLLNDDILIKDIPGVHVRYISYIILIVYFINYILSWLVIWIYLILQVAETFIPQSYAPLYQVNGISSLYNPKVEKGQISMSHIWVENGPVQSSNRITMGWHVSYYLWFIFF